MLNVITLVGRLTRDPELRQSQSGTPIGNFTIACDEGRKSPNGEKQTLFIDCAVFGPQSDTLIKFFHKGNIIAVSGRLVSRKYVNAQGVNVTAYTVNCDRIEFNDFGKKEEGQATAPQSNLGNQPTQPTANPSPVVAKNNVESLDVEDSDLPF